MPGIGRRQLFRNFPRISSPFCSLAFLGSLCFPLPRRERSIYIYIFAGVRFFQAREDLSTLLADWFFKTKSSLLFLHLETVISLSFGSIGRGLELLFAKLPTQQAIPRVGCEGLHTFKTWDWTVSGAGMWRNLQFPPKLESAPTFGLSYSNPTF